MYPKKTKYAGVILRSKNSIQIIMYFKGKRETETLMWEHTAVNLKKCYELKLSAESGFKDKKLNYAKLFPHSEKRFKYISHAGDSLTICQRLDLHYRAEDERFKAGELEYSSIDGYRKEINRLICYFKKYHPEMRLSELRTDHLEDWAKRRKVKQKTLGEELKHLRRIIKYAIGKSHIVGNILSDWSPTAPKKILAGLDGKGNEVYKKEHEKHPFTKDEIKRILESALVIAPEQYSFILIRFALGLRPSEIVGLRWERLNEINNSIHILETVVLNKFKPKPKSGSGNRILALNKPAQVAIDIQKKLTYGQSEYIFIDHANSNTNNWWMKDTLRRAWIKILAHANVEYRRSYNTRHSCATQLIEAGESIYNIAKMLGHKDMRVTIKNYAGGKNDGEIIASDTVDSFITI